MRTFRRFNCADCGAYTERYRDTGQPDVCRTCGIARAVNAAVELARCKAQGWPADSQWPKSRFQGRNAENRKRRAESRAKHRARQGAT